MSKPHCYGNMEWVLKYPKDEIPKSSMCSCEHTDKCLELTLNLEKKKEAQEFNLGDTAYMIDEDFKFFESEVYRVELSKGKYLYDTYDVEFEYKDIGEWVFKSERDRQLYLELVF